MNWTGSAAVCINENNQLLMVLQGKPEEEKKWSVPSGGREANETYEECCMREVLEETGYQIAVKELIFCKNEIVYYYFAEVIGGSAIIQDPDELIYDIAWKSVEELRNLNLSFEEDREFLISILEHRH
ncbi:NUDIX hydrolase [Paenibacillus sp. N1-5-1-14]|uniref:NUDIX hydrolase n=1 Tax=Paenibacillus radicibacter TaxID=2972488 RepID=UPI002158F787|nr:NUDIX hydrolase [Paenibacillus radicibacter]MCR8641268.1 NUDIX hydrolase [Paenibacillus radicibacter]